jgi:primosomal protein N' (replication factor Y)
MAGRAGRGSAPGRVLVQTYKPDHYVLQRLDDVPGFVDTELRLRGTLRYPPFSRLVLVRVDGVNRQAVVTAARALAQEARATSRGVEGVTVLGPAAAALPRLVGRWRFQVILRGMVVGPFRTWLVEAAPRLRKHARKGVRVHLDVDPRSLM